MSTSKAKRKFNKATYRRYEFSVRLDSKLEYLLDRYLSKPDNSLSSLVKHLLCEHFCINPDDIWVPIRLHNVNGKWIEVPNTDLDEIIDMLNL